MSKKIIGFDLDGVIIDHTGHKIKLAAERGFILTPEKTGSDIIRNFIPAKQVQEIQYHLYDHPVSAFESPLMNGAKFGLRAIKKSGVSYYLISRRKNTAMAVKVLERHRLWPKYFNSDNAFFVQTKEDKNKKSATCGVTHYIDDEISVLEKLTFVKNKFLFNQFNILTADNNFIKISSWSELINLLVK